MSRRRGNYKREIVPDPVYKDEVVGKFVNHVMLCGKKGVAQRIVYGMLKELETKTPGESPVAAFKKAVEAVKPALEVRSRRVGGATYQVPVDVRPQRRQTLSMRWIIQYARQRNEKTMSLRLAGEISDALQNSGQAIKKRDDVHRMAEANRAFSHYNW